MPASPSIQNYHIGKGIVCSSRTAQRPLSILEMRRPSFWTPTIEKKEHFSSREGVKTKDFTAVVQTGATIKVTLDEINGENLAIFSLGEKGTDTDGNIT